MFWNHGCTTFYFCLLCLCKDQRKHLVLFSHLSPGARKRINLICHSSSQISGGTSLTNSYLQPERPCVFNVYTSKLFQSAYVFFLTTVVPWGETMSSMNFYSCNEDMAKLFLFLLWNKTTIWDGIDSAYEVSAMLYLLNQFSASLKNVEWHSDDQAVYLNWRCWKKTQTNKPH